MAARAVCSFREQTYERKWLLILDQGGCGPEETEIDIAVCHYIDGASIGALRNAAIRLATQTTNWPSDIIAHFDDDDVSAPQRLTEQVALLQSSGAECVGYNEMLFWDTRGRLRNRMVAGVDMSIHESTNEAWIYRAVNLHHLLGTSLMYWRSTWERQPFDDINHGEDARFVMKLKVCGLSSIVGADPRMIASIHGGNSSGYAPENDRAGSRRAPEWADYCAERMRL